jgi:hemerythrin-like metal-binding protein
MIKWNDKYSVGISVIDEAHKEFIDIINKVIATKGNNGKPEEVREVLYEMVKYALKHYATEESYMEKFNFPEYQLHRSEHLDFTDKAVANINKVINGDYQVANEILEYLKRWFVNHIQKTDRKYIDCFNENGLGNAGLKKDLQIFQFKSHPPQTASNQLYPCES